MAGKISELVYVTPLDGTEDIEIVSDGVSKRTSTQDIADLAGGGIITVKISLSSAEILALSTTPKTLIAAQGAGTYINVLSAAFRYNFVSAAYATNYTLRLELGSMNPLVTTNIIITGTSNDWIVSSPTQTLEVSGSPDWVNVPLKARIVGGNPTAGDSTVDIYVTYNVITL